MISGHSVTLFLVLLLVRLSLSSPLGLNFEKRSSLPILTLPYGSYRASSYNPLSDIYTFKNIRYAQAPVGDLRWAKPAPPLVNSTLQDGSYGNKCVQTAINGLNLVGTGNDSPAGAAINQFLGGLPIPIFKGGDEDCLFLDVYVPGAAIRKPSLKLPVAVWIFGGGYVFGSKDSMQADGIPFYDGSGLIESSNNGIIFVAMNYRLGAYGWLAGTSMERDASPNAGLLDQRAALQWVQDYISLVGGDPTRVTAMGESAGAGSILHHLVGQGGKLDPLFSKAILLSPAFEYIWDRAGLVEQTFQRFAALAGCGGRGVACLRNASSAILQQANTALMAQQTAGSFAVGPTPDGSLIRQLPVLELSSGNFWELDSMILSHCAHESSIFVSGAIQTDQQFSDFVGKIFPNYTASAGINNMITSFYPPVSGGKSTYQTQSDRVEAFIRDSSFTCNTRYLAESYGDSKVWAMQYSVSPGWHGTDLFPTFYSSQFTGTNFLESLATLMIPVIGPLVAGISTALQSYFASYVQAGDPNANRKVFNLPPTVRWDHPNSAGEQIAGIVNVGDWGFGTASDDQNPKSACDFWRNVAAAATSLGGYSPPDALVSQNLVQIVADPSANYVGGNSS